MDLTREEARSRSEIFRDQVLGRLEESVGSSFIREKLAPLLLSPSAKLLRPRLVSVFGSVAGAKTEGLIDIAASAELLHVASLVHDDIVDESDERRGMPTLHKLSGNQIAVLAGDYLLAQALKFTARGGSALVDAAARAMAEMSEAAAHEVEVRSAPGGAILAIDRESLRKLACGKTGALFGYCLEAAALVANQADLARRWRQAGLHLGVAFQYLDDVLDLRGGAGKPQGADLRERNPNAVVSAAAQMGIMKDGEYRNLAELIQLGRYPEACDRLLVSAAVNEVYQWIEQELVQARLLIGNAMSTPEVAAIFDQLRPR
ncbi:hypothetical protein EBZ37_09725 [bacterium]|nr:hypothetical protein [bacterium]